MAGKLTDALHSDSVLQEFFINTWSGTKDNWQSLWTYIFPRQSEAAARDMVLELVKTYTKRYRCPPPSQDEKLWSAIVGRGRTSDKKLWRIHMSIGPCDGVVARASAFEHGEGARLILAGALRLLTGGSDYITYTSPGRNSVFHLLFIDFVAFTASLRLILTRLATSLTRMF